MRIQRMNGAVLFVVLAACGCKGAPGHGAGPDSTAMTSSGWGALVGGLIGALVGVPVPIIGSVIGGFVGAFAGAALFEYTRARASGGAVRAGWGAVLGRAAAVAVKMGLGVVLVVGSLALAVRG